MTVPSSHPATTEEASAGAGSAQRPGRLVIAARIFLGLGLAAVFSQFLRAATGVIAPDLMRDLDLSSEQMGALTAAFFFTLAVVQIPTGVLLDRYGSRWTISGLLLFGAAGCFLMGRSDGFAGLLVARILMGAGCAGIMMGALAVCSRWYSRAAFATAAGVMIAISNGGSILATTPMAVAAVTFGWRETFFGLGLISLAIGVVNALVVRDAPPGHDFHKRQSGTIGDVVRGLRLILGNRDLPYVLAIGFVTYATTISVLGLWAAPYLENLYGADPVWRGNVLLAMSLALIAATLSYGMLEKALGSRRLTILLGGSGSVVTLLLLGLLPTLPALGAAALLTLFALFNGFSVLIVAHGQALFPDSHVGRGMTTVNIAVQTGAGTLQVTTGLLIGAFGGTAAGAPEIAYRAMFVFLAVALACALLVYRRSRT